MISYGKIINAEFIPNNKDSHAMTLKQLEGKEVQCKITEKKDTRTVRQNSLLWKYYNIIADETGDDPNSLHEFFKRKFLPVEVIETSFYQGAMTIPGSSATLSKKEFSDYLLRINALTGIPCPAKEQYAL